MVVVVTPDGPRSFGSSREHGYQRKGDSETMMMPATEELEAFSGNHSS